MNTDNSNSPIRPSLCARRTGTYGGTIEILSLTLLVWSVANIPVRLIAPDAIDHGAQGMGDPGLSRTILGPRRLANLSHPAEKFEQKQKRTPPTNTHTHKSPSPHPHSYANPPTNPPHLSPAQKNFQKNKKGLAATLQAQSINPSISQA